MELKIVIPSHKRWANVRTTSAIEGVTLCIPESQRRMYEACNPGIELVTHPDAVVGLVRKRQWILEHFGDVFMVDDDIDAVRRMYAERGETLEVPPAQARAVIEAAADCARQLGIFFFGFSNKPNPMYFNALEPIKLSGWINGCAFGVLKGSKLWYNADITCNCDYWISALNAHYHRMAWIDERFYFAQADTFVGRGGQAEHRNLEAERKDFELLQRVFGEDVIAMKQSKSLKHPFQKTLKLPF